MSKNITAEELAERMQTRALHILDVRKQEAFLADPNMIHGAARHPPQEIDQWKRALPGDAEIVVYCVHGHEVSQDVCRILNEHGLDARYLEGGIEGWKATGGETAAG